MKTLSKIKHQIKSGKYYIFWGACTIAVMAGQIYVGAGYRHMSESVDDLVEYLTDPRPKKMPVEMPYQMPIIR